MTEIVVFDTENFECVIVANNIERCQKVINETLSSRNEIAENSVIHFSPPLDVKGSDSSLSEYQIEEPVFFENTQYNINFIFSSNCLFDRKKQQPRVEHKLRSVEEAFHFTDRNNTLSATINTGNDIGCFEFSLLYFINGKEVKQFFSFDILPLKMDLISDLHQMNTVLDQELPLWRYSLAEKTQQNMAAKKGPTTQFLLLWLVQLESLWSDMDEGLKHIVNSPHSRLVTIKKSMKMDKLRGRLNQQTLQKIALAKSEKRFDKRFSVNKKQLSVDTPENQFIKSVVSIAINKLIKIKGLPEFNLDSAEPSRLSDSFKEQIDNWYSRLNYYHRHPFFKEVGKFNGLSKESLILQQKSGYSTVYRVWQQLKWFLELLGDDRKIATRNVAEIYELWCFLEVRRIVKSLGFIEGETRRIPLHNKGLQVTLKDGMAGAFHFFRSDGVELKLAHEPIFKRQGEKIRSWVTTQKPDILLEATFPDGHQFIWLFDAKYRIKMKPTYIEDEFNDKEDMVPDDAINQMHRYRDALIYLYKDQSGITKKSRPVLGAYALYPGFWPQKEKSNPYEAAIDEIGIGAFSLLPSEDYSGSYWLQEFLEKRLGQVINNIDSPLMSSDRYFVEEASRIPYRGITASKYTDLTIVASSLGPDRSVDYVERFKLGKAKCYHTRAFAFERQSIESHVVLEARYLCVAVNNQAATHQEIRYLYPIIESKKVKRSKLDASITGVDKGQYVDDDYWLFELGKATVLQVPIIKILDNHFSIKLTSSQQIAEGKRWDDLDTRYESIAVSST